MKSKRFFRRLVAFICIITINLSGVAQSPSVLTYAEEIHNIGSSSLIKPDGSNDPLEYDRNDAVQGEEPDAILFCDDGTGTDYAPMSVLTVSGDTILYVKWSAAGGPQNPDPNQPVPYPANPNDPAKQDTTVDCGDPVNVVTGSFTWEYTDIALYGAEELAFTRRYDSRDAYSGAMGYKRRL